MDVLRSGAPEYSNAVVRHNVAFRSDAAAIAEEIDEIGGLARRHKPPTIGRLSFVFNRFRKLTTGASPAGEISGLG
jgi:hypothetical protein